MEMSREVTSIYLLAPLHHYSDVIMSVVVCQITGVWIVYWTVCQCTDKKTLKLCVTSLCVENSPVTSDFLHKRPVTWKNFPFDDVIMFAVTSHEHKASQITGNSTVCLTCGLGLQQRKYKRLLALLAGNPTLPDGFHSKRAWSDQYRKYQYNDNTVSSLFYLRIPLYLKRLSLLTEAQVNNPGFTSFLVPDYK